MDLHVLVRHRLPTGNFELRLTRVESMWMVMWQLPMYCALHAWPCPGKGCSSPTGQKFCLKMPSSWVRSQSSGRSLCKHPRNNKPSSQMDNRLFWSSPAITRCSYLVALAGYALLSWRPILTWHNISSVNFRGRSPALEETC